MIFIYLDESGNYTFAKKGSQYLIFTSLTTQNPYGLHYHLCELERNLKKENISLSSGYFHATEDKQIVRNRVYQVLSKHDSFEIDSVIVEKPKINPSLHDIENLYPKIYKILLKYVLYRYKDVTKIMLFLDNIPINKKKCAIEKSIKKTLSTLVEKKKTDKDIKYHLLFSSATFSYGLQAVDYCCWTLKKKWGDWDNKIDLRPYDELKSKVKSELDICLRGDGTIYY